MLVNCSLVKIWCDQETMIQCNGGFERVQQQVKCRQRLEVKGKSWESQAKEVQRLYWVKGLLQREAHCVRITLNE